MKLRDFIVAEDVRTEVGNKHSIVGILGDEITVRSDAPGAVPAPPGIRLGFFVRLEMDPSDPDLFAFEFRATMKGGDVLVFAGAGGKGHGKALLVLPLVANIVPIPEPGPITFALRVTEQKSGAVVFAATELRPLTIKFEAAPSP
jgi:hypothetical protein